MKKIALIGTHGCGKTTLAYDFVSALKKAGKNAEFLGETVRDCPFPINEETTEKAQRWIIFMQLIKEMEKEDKYDYLVCDRSILDSYIYYVRKFGRNQLIEKLVLEHLRTYYLIFRVPIKKEFLKDDGVRSVSEKFQEEIDELFTELIPDFRIDVHDFKDIYNAMNIVLENE